MSLDFKSELEKLILEKLSKTINIKQSDSLVKQSKSQLVDDSTRKLGFSKLKSTSIRP